MEEVTRWLNQSTDSSEDEEMFVMLYAELRKIAGARMAGEREGHTLSATALVNEAWLRLQKSMPEEWRDRKQFYGAAAEAMRRILVEAARRRLASKRGGAGEDDPLDEEIHVFASLVDERLLGIDEVLDRLEKEDEMKGRIVKLRFFGGMKHDEIAALLEVSEVTVRRHWLKAKMWLYDAMNDDEF
jgi:RNA polymerase sigma factor (TIGR02999 family)